MHRAFKDRALMETFDIAPVRSCLFPSGSSVLIFGMLSCSVVSLFTLFFECVARKKGNNRGDDSPVKESIASVCRQSQAPGFAKPLSRHFCEKVTDTLSLETE